MTSGRMTNGQLPGCRTTSGRMTSGRTTSGRTARVREARGQRWPQRVTESVTQRAARVTQAAEEEAPLQRGAFPEPQRQMAVLGAKKGSR